MLNRTPWWQALFIAGVVLGGGLYALPNLFGSDPGIQVRATRGGSVERQAATRIGEVLRAEGIEVRHLEAAPAGIRIRLGDAEQQLTARDIVSEELGDAYTTALTLLPATPNWLGDLGGQPLFLGLDLRGGVYFLLEVDLEDAVKRARDGYVAELKSALRAAKLRYRSLRASAGDELDIVLRDVSQLADAERLLARDFTELELVASDPAAGSLRLKIGADRLGELHEFALSQNMTALRSRIDQLGVAEPVVQRQGQSRIVVQLPGVQDIARAKGILGRAATLQMHLVDEENTLAAEASGQAPAASRLYRFRDGRPILLKREVIYSGDNIVNAAASIDQTSGGAVVSITLDSAGARINSRVTGENVGRRLAVVYQEQVSEPLLDAAGLPLLDAGGQPQLQTRLIEEVLTAPVIRDQLGRRYQIEGIGSVAEARDLALMLRAGALAAPVRIVEERTIGPSLGQANINRGFFSVLLGFALVLAFMPFYYRTFGWVANVALSINLVLIIAVLSLFQATLTLPGVAGIVLTVGMAVDANVLIFERIREELRNGNSPQASIHVGYDKAFSTIVDANITTLIAALVLFNFGTGPIKGFAITLSIGILTSMFSAILLTRALVNWRYGGRRVSELPI